MDRRILGEKQRIPALVGLRAGHYPEHCGCIERGQSDDGIDGLAAGLAAISGATLGVPAY
jgi:hypothetical protein